MSETMKVILTYNNESYSIDVPTFKKLKFIKEKAYKVFYPIKTEIDLKYNNKSLSSLLEQSVGMIFNEKSFVRLVVVSIPGVHKSQKLKANKIRILTKALEFESNNKSPIKSNNYEGLTPRENKREIIINNSNKVKTFTIKKNKSLEKFKTETNTNKKNVNKLNKIEVEDLKLKKNGRKKLPPIKTENNKAKKDIVIVEYNKCSECIKNIISEYCRKCNKFLCLNCTNKNHNNQDHKLIEIDENNEKINISRYKEELNKDLYNSLNYFNNLNADMDENLDLEKSKQNLEKLINNLSEVVQGIKDNINDNLGGGTYNGGNKEKIKNELNSIKSELQKEKFESKIKQDEINVFKELYLKDKKINRLIKDYKANNNVVVANNKIQRFFEDIEDEVDKVIFDIIELEKDMNMNIGNSSDLKN